MKVYTVEKDINNLLLVITTKNWHNNKTTKHVINGGYNLKQDKKGYYIPKSNLRVQYLGKIKPTKDQHGGTDYNTTIKNARQKLHMPLFDKPT